MGTDKILSSKAIGEKVKFLRQSVGMSQERLAEILEVSYQQVQRYEGGQNKISVERIQQIAQGLGVSVAYFFEGGPAAPIVFESPSHYAPSDEEKTLLKYFRRVSEKAGRQFVITAARQAAKKSN